MSSFIYLYIYLHINKLVYIVYIFVYIIIIALTEQKFGVNIDKLSSTQHVDTDTSVSRSPVIRPADIHTATLVGSHVSDHTTHVSDRDRAGDSSRQAGR